MKVKKTVNGWKVGGYELKESAGWTEALVTRLLAIVRREKEGTK